MASIGVNVAQARPTIPTAALTVLTAVIGASSVAAAGAFEF